jgi:HlyD family secretion protein
MKKAIPVLLVAAAGAAYYFLRLRPVPDAASGPIRVSGNIEMTLVDVAFKAPGKIVEVNFEEGQPVREGDVLARQDAESVQWQRRRDLAAVAGAQGAVEQVRTLVSWQTESIERELELRRADLRQAEARLKDLQAGARPQEIEQMEAALAEARAQHRQAAADWDRAQRLYKNEDISTAQHDLARTRFTATAAAVSQLEQRLALIREGPRAQEVEAARAAVERARAAVRLAEAGRLEIRRKQQELATRQQDVERARAQVGLLDTALADSVLRAPISGVVLVKSVEPGEVVNAGVPVASIARLDKPWVRAYITERQLGRVRLGQPARVFTDSFPGKTYSGRVSFISSEAEFTPKQIQTSEERVKLVYRVKIDVDNPNQELKVNMPVDAEIGGVP